MYKETIYCFYCCSSYNKKNENKHLKSFKHKTKVRLHFISSRKAELTTNNIMTGSKVME